MNVSAVSESFLHPIGEIAKGVSRAFGADPQRRPDPRHENRDVNILVFDAAENRVLRKIFRTFVGAQIEIRPSSLS